MHQDQGMRFSDPLFVNRQQGVDESVPANRQQCCDKGGLFPVTREGLNKKEEKR